MNKNTDGLKAYQLTRSTEKSDAVKKAIDDLKILNQEINFVSVAKKSGVSRKYIYSKPELSELIRVEKPASIVKAKSKIVQFSASAKSAEHKIKTLTARCKYLMNENADLKKEIKLLQQHIEDLT